MMYIIECVILYGVGAAIGFGGGIAWYNNYPMQILSVGVCATLTGYAIMGVFEYLGG